MEKIRELENTLQSINKQLFLLKFTPDADKGEIKELEKQKTLTKVYISDLEVQLHCYHVKFDYFYDDDMLYAGQFRLYTEKSININTRYDEINDLKYNDLLSDIENKIYEFTSGREYENLFVTKIR